jgi:hypothetical protein
MTKDELQQAHDAAQAELEAVKARLAAAEAALEAGDPLPMGAEFPQLMYRAGGKPTQIDHPGNETHVVNSPEEREAAIADGWQAKPIIQPA